MHQCDETRPSCKSCSKAKLTCEYELPTGQTRQQALVENQSKIQHELEAHASLISTLRTLPSNAAVEVLSRLRGGQYDGILVDRRESRDDTESQQGSFPWEYPVDNAEEDASGGEDEAYPDATASLPQRYTHQSMPRVEQNLQYQWYYAPFMLYQDPASKQQSLGMSVPAEQFRHGQIETSQQFSQQFHMGPLAEESHITTGQRSKRAPPR
ncbi:hypothetical protein B0A48_18384 [Cryoendolithus antarcticus]|uniref:Zn(2)-C6 fungal-type domain-containing protein n=1 Tax=Cryoendolithus antarcticus TaxID=1507870 RepID=A0A1V8S9D9_9PEZI|nr:hypothetical protein B0A48_18384 [Cryoendolithus antarcticus]